MDERISIATPDHVELDFELAGLGSRLIALLIDWLLIFTSIIFLFLFAGALAGFSLRASASTASWSLALTVIVVFGILWGYFVVFEATQNGQTPGKKRAGIRVVRDDGLPIGWREASLRNLVRIADMLPPPSFVVGGLAIMWSQRGKRLGDMVAGTIVVREKFGEMPAGSAARWQAALVLRLESGRSRQGMVLTETVVDSRQLEIISRFLGRRHELPDDQRQRLASRIAEPFLKDMSGANASAAARSHQVMTGGANANAERVLEEIMELANAAPQQAATADATEEKRVRWQQLEQKTSELYKSGPAGLRRLQPNELARFIEDYRRLACDLARARSVGVDSGLVQNLNRLTVRAHNILYSHLCKVRRKSSTHWVNRFPIAVRQHLGAVALSAALMFGPAVVSYIAVQVHPDLGYDLVAEGFLNFEPARPESLHNIPSIARPIAASSILTNNIQVTLLAFGLGLTAGIGTCVLLIFNGVHLGAVAGWMTAKGNSRALWGWIMPHGGTELLAITLAGAAGFALARAIVVPGEMRRTAALQKVGTSTLIIELGVMAMLVVAGCIEGFVSPSSIGFTARIVVLVASLVFWIGYLVVGSVRRQP